MSRYFGIFALAAIATALAACSTNPVPEVPGPNDSIVFGHIDMGDAPVDLDWVSVRQFSPPSDKPYWSFGTEEGTFYNWYLDPGAYGVQSFGGLGGRTRYSFNIPRRMRSMRIVIKKAGIYYLGSYRYSNIKPPWNRNTPWFRSRVASSIFFSL